MTSSIATSIRDRLRNKASDERTDFQLLLIRFACERFLYRLSKSAERERCILKGGTLLGLWIKEPYRTTRDIDLLATGRNDEEAVRRAMTTICNVPCPEDGLNFALDTLRVSSILQDQIYGGQRAKLRVFLGRTRIPVQVDFGYGDEVTPGAEEAQLPTLIDDVPAPVLYTYPKVTTIAEKFDAMVQLGTRNSRMKDFYDIWALSENFAFDGVELQQAVARCFKRRGRNLPAETPQALAPAFYSNEARQAQWQDYCNRDEQLRAPPNDFGEIGSRVQSFLGPVYTSILADETFDLHWPAGGPWQTKHKPYPAYKGSGVEWLDDIPVHWEVRRLKQVCSSSSLYGANVAAIDYRQSGVRFLRTTDITDEGLLKEEGVFLPKELVNDFLLDDGDLLISRSGTVGRSFLYESELHGTCSYAGYLVRFVPDAQVVPKYIFYFSKAQEFDRFLGAMAISSTIENVNAEKYANAHLPIPPLAEQRAIAAFLDRETAKIDALVSKKERLIELLQEKRTALISHTVTKGLNSSAPLKESGVEWLGEIPAHWEVLRLRYLADGNLTYGANAAAEYVDPNWPRYLRITDFAPDGTLREDTFRTLPPEIARDHLVEPGDLLLARSGATVGKAFLVDAAIGQACHAGYLIRVRPRRNLIEPKFLYAFALSRAFACWKDSTFIIATIQNISAEKYANLPIPTPPLTEQHAIVALLNQETTKLDNLIAKVHDATKLLKEFRAALISAAVTGKIDVREEMECT